MLILIRATEIKQHLSILFTCQQIQDYDTLLYWK
jgi:hypothetical protein